MDPQPGRFRVVNDRSQPNCWTTIQSILSNSVDFESIFDCLQASCTLLLVVTGSPPLFHRLVVKIRSLPTRVRWLICRGFLSADKTTTEVNLVSSSHSARDVVHTIIQMWNPRDRMVGVY